MGAVTVNVALELDGDEADLDKAAELVEGMPEIFQAVVAERHAQDLRWGGPQHDDQHTAQDWHDLLYRLLDEVEGAHRDGDEAEYRRVMVEIAASTVAAVQSFDRLHTHPEPAEG